MDKIIYTKLHNVLKAEAEYVMNNELDINEKLNKMNTILRLTQILDNYDELESTLKQFFVEKAYKQKYLPNNDELEI